MKTHRIRTISLVGLFAALTVVLSALESALPPLPLPGARLGLANVAVTAATALLSSYAGLCVAVIKVLFVLVTRGATASWMALCGTVAAVLITIALLPFVRQQRMSFVGISVASATAHTLGQLAAASWMLSTAVWGYAPLLLAFGMVAGCITGLVLNILLERLESLITKIGL